jgi:hypothetical protein
MGAPVLRETRSEKGSALEREGESRRRVHAAKRQEPGVAAVFALPLIYFRRTNAFGFVTFFLVKQVSRSTVKKLVFNYFFF